MFCVFISQKPYYFDSSLEDSAEKTLQEAEVSTTTTALPVKPERHLRNSKMVQETSKFACESDEHIPQDAYQRDMYIQVDEDVSFNFFRQTSSQSRTQSQAPSQAQSQLQSQPQSHAQSSLDYSGLLETVV